MCRRSDFVLTANILLENKRRGIQNPVYFLSVMRIIVNQNDFICVVNRDIHLKEKKK